MFAHAQEMTQTICELTATGNEIHEPDDSTASREMFHNPLISSVFEMMSNPTRICFICSG